jgi:putative transposase
VKIEGQKHQRRSIRLPDYDYSQPGAYFVTLCTWQRASLFGEIVNGNLRLSPIGRIVTIEWERLVYHFANIHLDAFVVMPNHLHGIITIIDPVRVGATQSLPTHDLSGMNPLPAGISSGPDGSPVRATQSLPTHDPSGMNPLPAGISSGPDGSPLRNGPDGSPVRATHATRSIAQSGDGALPTNALVGPDGSPLHNGPNRGSLGAIIGQFKSRATKRIWTIPVYHRLPIWQRNFYEHIIRDNTEWARIFEYIQNNPVRWQEDQLHPDAPTNSIIQEYA